MQIIQIVIEHPYLALLVFMVVLYIDNRFWG